jgi:hypothetical protein
MPVRNIIGSVLALIGAAATLVSPWQSWYNNRHGSTYKFYEVFGTGITVSRSGIMDSVFLIFLVMAILTVVGVLLRSRALVLAAGVVSFGFTILWMVRQGQAAGELAITGSNNHGLGSGLAWAFGGGLLMIIGSLVMTGRWRDVGPVARTGDRDSVKQRTTPAASAPPAIATTAPADRTPSPAPPATAEKASTSESGSAPASERTGTERLSKEERQMLGLDEDAPTKPKSQN